MILGIDTTFLIQLEIKEVPGHEKAVRFLKEKVLSQGDVLALAPQVLTEFLHVVTDSKRFEKPLSMDQAVAKARFWWHSREVKPVFPKKSCSELFMGWLLEHRLGRKRLLDTMLLATYLTNDITAIVTSNGRDYSLFEEIQIMDPLHD